MSAGRTLLAACVALSCLPIHAAVRLTYQVNGVAIPVAWTASNFPIHYVVDRKVVDGFPLGTTTIDQAFHEWAAVPDAVVAFDAPVVADARAGKDGQNSVTFLDDLFQNQKFLALTTNWYDNSGHMTEADIQIDPSVVSGGYNLQLLVAHEAGHLLGLDHSAVLSSVMYPYVGRGGISDLDSDDKLAIAALYPRIDPTLTGATLKGEVTGDGGAIFAAQVVAMNEQGEPVATALTDQQGDFVIQGIPAGTYRLYAEPLDGPVDVKNLSGVWRSANVVSFPTEFAVGGPLRVGPGKVYGNLLLNAAGTETLNPKWVGSFLPGSSDVALGACPVVLTAGQTVAIAVGGDGFVSGLTTFEIPNQGFHRVSGFSYAGNYVYATFTIADETPPGSMVILVSNGNKSAALTGALRLTPRSRARVVSR